MGLHPGSAARQLILQIAENPSVVFGQYWVSSHSSSQLEDSQLQPGGVPQGGPALAERATGHPVLQLEITDFAPLGRTAAQVGRLRPPQNIAQAMKKFPPQQPFQNALK